MSKTPLIHKLAERKEIPVELMNYPKPVYDPITQKSKYSFGGGSSTACPKGTDGTKPKDEADQVMDD